jgi:ankyrin repeat protein
VLALIDHGAPLDSEVSNPNFQRYTQAPEGSETAKLLAEFPAYKAPVVAGFSLMESAIQLGQVRLFNKLVATGWVDRVGKAQVAQLFAEYAAGCSPVLVDAAADAGIDIDEPDLQRGRTALANLANAATAHLCGNRETERLATAQRLLARGANPNHRDNVGQTPLFAVPNPDMVKLLLAHGAERR